MTKHCAHCDIEVSGNYCSHCGQQIGEKESTLWSILADTLLNLIDLDRSAFAAVLYVIRSPRKIISSYWRGNRKLYASPGKVLLYALALAALHLTQVNDTILGGSVSAEVNDDPFGDKEIIFWVIVIPFLVMTSVLAFIRKKMRVAKHFVSVLYISTAFFIVLTIFQDIFFLTLGMDPFFGMGMLIFLLLVFTWNSMIFNEGKGAGYVVLGALLQALALASIIATIALLIIVLNTESFSVNER